MNPSNGIIGDSFGTDLPQMPVDDTATKGVRNKGRYNKSKEFQALKAKMVERILYYQKFLPDGRPIATGQVPTPEQWMIANIVIEELTMVINEYQSAEDMVKELNDAG